MVLNALFIYTHYPVKIPSGSLHWPVDTLTYELVLYRQYGLSRGSMQRATRVVPSAQLTTLNVSCIFKLSHFCR